MAGGGVIRLTIDTLGSEIVARELLRMAGRTDDLRPVMNGVADLLRDSTREQFDSQGASGSGGWKPLAASTVERKARAGLDPRILHATLALRESLTGTGGANIAISRRDGLDFGTTVEYAKYHSTSRPPVQLPERDRRSIVRLVQRYLIDGEMARGGILGGVL